MNCFIDKMHTNTILKTIFMVNLGKPVAPTIFLLHLFLTCDHLKQDKTTF